MNRSETWELLERLEFSIGIEETVDSICQWFSSDEIGECLLSISRDYEVDTSDFE